MQRAVLSRKLARGHRARAKVTHPAARARCAGAHRDRDAHRIRHHRWPRQIIAGVVLITAGYSADGKYSHFFLTQVPLKIGNFRLAPGSYLIGWEHEDDALNVKFYEPAPGSTRFRRSKIESLHHSGRIVSRLATCRSLADTDWAIHLQLPNWRLDFSMQPEKSDPKKRRKLLNALAANWQTETSGYFTYQTLAERDADPLRKQTLHHMAQAEAQHAALWAARINELGGAPPKYHGKSTGDADSLANRMGGERMALRRLKSTRAAPLRTTAGSFRNWKTSRASPSCAR